MPEAGGVAGGRRRLPARHEGHYLASSGRGAGAASRAGDAVIHHIYRSHGRRIAPVCPPPSRLELVLMVSIALGMVAFMLYTLPNP